MFGSAARGRGGRQNNNNKGRYKGNNGNNSSGGWGSAHGGNNSKNSNQTGWGSNKSNNQSSWGPNSQKKTNNAGWGSGTGNRNNQNQWGTNSSRNNTSKGNRGARSGGFHQPSSGWNNTSSQPRNTGGGWGTSANSTGSWGSAAQKGNNATSSNSSWGGAQQTTSNGWGGQHQANTWQGANSNTQTSWGGNSEISSTYQKGSVTLTSMGEVSAVAWSVDTNPKNLLGCSSWDGSVRIYDPSPSTQPITISQAPMQWDLNCPVLDMTFVPNNCCVAATSDGKGMLYDISSKAARQVSQHSDSISCLSWVPGLQLLVTGGWDRQLSYWDFRQQAPVTSLALPERCYSISTDGTTLVVATAERQLLFYNLQQPQQPVLTTFSPLPHQTRRVSILPGNKYAVASVNGTIACASANSAEKGEYSVKQGNRTITPINDMHFTPSIGGGYLGACSGAGEVMLLAPIDRNLVPVYRKEYHNFSADCLALDNSAQNVAVGLSTSDDWTLDWESLQRNHTGGFGNVQPAQGKIVIQPIDPERLEQTRRNGGLKQSYSQQGNRGRGRGGNRGRGRGGRNF